MADSASSDVSNAELLERQRATPFGRPLAESRHRIERQLV
jgi:hypothetical protein